MHMRSIATMIIIVVFVMYVFYSMGYFRGQITTSSLTSTTVERESVSDVKQSTTSLELNEAFLYALRKLPEDEALIFKNIIVFNDTVKKLIDLYANLSGDNRNSEDIKSLIYTILSDGAVNEKELNLFDDKFVNPTKPVIVGFNFTPVRVINDKIYDVRVNFNVRDDKTGIIYVKLLFIPVEYEYFITKYGMKPEDYGKVFPPDKERVYELKPLDEELGGLEESFSVDIKDIVGGREYKMVVVARDEAGNEGYFEFKTPYIREYENIGKLNDLLIGVYYYPWYSPERHWQEGFKGEPILGMYNSRDPIVISKHIDWATGHGINTFIISWWGPGSWEDVTLRSYILKNDLVKNINFFILYESNGRLDLNANLEDQRNVRVFFTDFDYLAYNYFNNSQYLKINGKPVVILYLARAFKGNVSGVLSDLRTFLMERYHQDVYIVGDLVYWQDPASEFEQARIRLYNAVTAYNMHTSVKEILDNFEERLIQKYGEWWNVLKRLGVGFIPSAIPGFDDSAVRSVNIPLPKSPERFKKEIEIAKMYIDENLKMIIITTFNEWHEYTSIEPSREYGMNYLEILTKLDITKR